MPALQLFNGVTNFGGGHTPLYAETVWEQPQPLIHVEGVILLPANLAAATVLAAFPTSMVSSIATVHPIVVYDSTPQAAAYVNLQVVNGQLSILNGTAGAAGGSAYCINFIFNPSN